MAGSGSLNISNFPKLIDDSYAWAMQSYAAAPVTYPRVFNTSPPQGFDPMKPVFRQAVGVMNLYVQERKPSEEKRVSGAFEDYYWMMSKHRLTSTIVVEQDIINAGENRLVDFMREFAAEVGPRHAMTIDKKCANLLNYGALTAGYEGFNNSFPVSDGSGLDPYPLFIYDSLPLFDTTHYQSRLVTGTTYSNHDSTLTLTRSNLQAIYTTMSVTNAFDRDGQEMLVNPNQLIINPALSFTADSLVNAAVVDADLQPNTIGRKGWEVVEWRNFSSPTAFVVAEKQRGLHCVMWGAPKMVSWVDNETDESKVSYETYYGIGVSDWRYIYGAGLAAS